MSLPSLWIMEIPTGLAPEDAPLSADELARYHAISAPKRKLHFLAGRVLLKQALSEELKAPAASFQISAHPGEGPRLIQTEKKPCHISLSHSGQAVACLLAPNPCGVDIEDSSSRSGVTALAQAAFNGEMLARFEKDPSRESFFSLWTEWEARFKAGVPCAWLGRLSFKNYRLCMALPLTGIHDLVFYDPFPSF